MNLFFFLHVLYQQEDYIILTPQISLLIGSYYCCCCCCCFFCHHCNRLQDCYSAVVVFSTATWSFCCCSRCWRCPLRPTLAFAARSILITQTPTKKECQLSSLPPATITTTLPHQPQLQHKNKTRISHLCFQNRILFCKQTS